MRSLSHLLWSRRPDGETRTVSEFFAAVLTHRACTSPCACASPLARSRLINAGSAELLYYTAEAMLDGSIVDRFAESLWPTVAIDVPPDAALVVESTDSRRRAPPVT